MVFLSSSTWRRVANAGAALLTLGTGASAALADEAVYSYTSENDIFGGTDRNYTNGLRVERFTEANRVHPWLRTAARFAPNVDLDRTELRQGFAIAHAIFTPEDIEARAPDPTDRPYAGWLYASGTIVATTGDRQDSLQLNLGVVGESAGGEWVQSNFHELIDGKKPLGWDQQLRDEPGFEIIGQSLRRFDGPRLLEVLETDFAAHGALALGNVRTYAGAGMMGRIGFDLDADFGPPRIRPSLAGAGVYAPNRPLGGYLFAGIEGRAVGRDIFLDGNTFRDSPSVAKKALVGDAQLGIAVNMGPVQLACTYVHRTEQFKGQDGPQRFGAVSLSISR